MCMLRQNQYGYETTVVWNRDHRYYRLRNRDWKRRTCAPSYHPAPSALRPKLHGFAGLVSLLNELNEPKSVAGAILHRAGWSRGSVALLRC